MSAATKMPDAFGAMLCALQAAYKNEISRLADELRPRILAGEFSDWTPDEGAGKDEPRFLRLENELMRHPWIKTPAGARAALACSKWPDRADCTRYQLDGFHDREIAAESMAHDVMAVAVERRWVKPYRRYGPTYALRVA